MNEYVVGFNDDGTLVTEQVAAADKEQAKAEARAYERSHGFSGNFFKDMQYGMKAANQQFLKPFIKYAGPVVSKLGPEGEAIMKSTQGVSGVVDKLT